MQAKGAIEWREDGWELESVLRTGELLPSSKGHVEYGPQCQPVLSFKISQTSVSHETFNLEILKTHSNFNNN